MIISNHSTASTDAYVDRWAWQQQGAVLHGQQGQASVQELCLHATDAHEYLHWHPVQE